MTMNKRGLVCIVAGVVLLLSALGLSGYNIIDERQAGENVEKAYEQLRVYALEPGELELPEGLIPAYQVEPEVEMSMVEIDGHYYVGYVSLPTLDLELPVMSEWSYPNMKIAPCRYWGSVYLNNMVICAHNYVNHFGRLDGIAIGDPVTFTDVDGNVFQYQVSELLQLWPNQTFEMVKGNDWDLTLFTCTPSGRQRLTVRCVLAVDTPS